MTTIYESELVERHNRLNDGMDALSRVSGLDFDKRRDALETLRAARELVEQQLVAERDKQRMNILVCERCGYRASADYVAMADTCPGCNVTPFPVAETGVYDHGAREYTPNGGEL
jgi:predicted Zn-ribbon and HTH transcriptional regulator